MLHGSSENEIYSTGMNTAIKLISTDSQTRVVIFYDKSIPQQKLPGLDWQPMFDRRVKAIINEEGQQILMLLH